MLSLAAHPGAFFSRMSSSSSLPSNASASHMEALPALAGLEDTAPTVTSQAQGESSVAGTADAQDVSWMMRVRGGDRVAFAELVECHQARVVGTVARMLGGESADAEDIGQQVFLRVWKSAARYEPTAKFTTWLYTITRNLVFNEMRRRKHRPTASLDAMTSPSPDGMGETGAQFRDASAQTPDDALLEMELQQVIAAAIAELPETQRMAIVLRRYEELSYDEIGSVLGLTVPAVKSLLFRARGLLREKLARYLED